MAELEALANSSLGPVCRLVMMRVLLWYGSLGKIAL